MLKSGGDGENRVNFAMRDVLISGSELLSRNEWAHLDLGRPNKGDCSCVIGARFNGVDLCSFTRLVKYITYLMGV